MKAFLRFLWHAAVALVLAFVTLALVSAVPELPLDFDRRSTVLPAAIGFGVGLLVFALLCRFLALYVFGHELTHWLAAKLFLRKTGQFTVGQEGGNVAVDKPNVWITLAPYFIPVYSLLWVGLYGLYRLARHPHPPAPVAATVLYAGLGVTYAFHVVMTVVTLLREQGDVKPYGRLLALTLIVFGNVLVVYVGLLAASGHWREGARLAGHRLVSQVDLLLYLWQRLCNLWA